MKPPSFERIDYQLRCNKNIERRLVFERLERMKSIADFSNYSYIGFGSVWFVDFRIAHRRLGIHKMLSIEHAEYAERAKFNIPFGCIKVMPGEASNVLSAIDDEFWEKPSLIWLDYDGCLDPSVANDMAIVLDRAAPGSVFIISVNANFASYRPRNVSGPRNREHTTLGQLESILSGITVPPRFNKTETTATGNHPDVSAEAFPEMLSVMTLSWMTHRVASSGRKPSGASKTLIEFLPLFNFLHKDGAEMVTVGGVISPQEEKPIYQKQLTADVVFSTHERSLPAHERIDLIPMTLAEKSILDTCLPNSDADFMTSAKIKGIKISDDSLLKYRRYYRDYPVFLEAST
jgi:hypothetical protein